MLSISIEYAQSIYETKPSTEQPDYDEELDNIESVIMDICEVLSDTQTIRFRVSGFGEPAWPVDVGTDLATIISQIPDVLGALHQSENTSIQFYEQGIERELFFSCNNSRVEMACKPFILPLTLFLIPSSSTRYPLFFRLLAISTDRVLFPLPPLPEIRIFIKVFLPELCRIYYPALLSFFLCV